MEKRSQSSIFPWWTLIVKIWVFLKQSLALYAIYLLENSTEFAENLAVFQRQSKSKRTKSASSSLSQERWALEMRSWTKDKQETTTKWPLKWMNQFLSALLLATWTCSPKQPAFQLRWLFTCPAKPLWWSNTNYKMGEASLNTIWHPKSPRKNDLIVLSTMLYITSISSHIEENIGTWAINAALWDTSAWAIIEVVPTATILAVGCVVTTSQSSEMVAYCV